MCGTGGHFSGQFYPDASATHGRRADERDHLILQILLLVEKEVTASLGMEREVARKLGLTKVANDADVKELSQHTSIEEVTETLKEQLLVE